ncbi:homoserine O-succinyltransferase [Massilia sp. YMA4]|uniref:Homoserine O-succinyltransferase n=1 Tax=[Empedobacter] haloabium TaxID=592317 RepID=A0ABZ1UIJ8_9BURK|nr:homoserine O-succinyltransferase [Massilia sp. YMA4]AXA94113.1 hypothetical protein DPH57_25050 [Massilia sp. YMA4]
MNPLHVGVLNFMPNAQAYGRSVAAALQCADVPVELHSVRLRSHAYRSSGGDVAHYPDFEELTARVALDLLLVTGAPVEHLPYEQIHYFPELCAIFHEAERRRIGVMGICFGALALARYLGHDKRLMAQKVFGVHEVQACPGAERYLGSGNRTLQLPLSTWALLDPAGGLPGARPVKPLLRHREYGDLMLATEDEQLVMMLGHPEYTADMLYREWLRDRDDPANTYTAAHEHESFRHMELLLSQGGSPVLANWIRSHVRATAQAA